MFHSIDLSTSELHKLSIVIKDYLSHDTLPGFPDMENLQDKIRSDLGKLAHYFEILWEADVSRMIDMPDEPEIPES